MHNPLRRTLLHLQLQNLLSLLRLVRTHLGIDFRGGTSIRQFDFLNITRILQERGMRHKSAFSHSCAVLEPILLTIPAELRYKLASPAEARRSHGRGFGFVLFQVFEEFEDSGARDAGTTPEQEGTECSHRVEDVANFGEGEARGGNRFHGVH